MLASFPLTVADALGRVITLEKPPRRIVSLVPSQTELLAYLGLDKEVVGLTRFCVHPPAWKSNKCIVGGTKQVNMTRLRALKPDLILANKEENTQAIVKALDDVAPVCVTDISTVAEALAMIRLIGQLTDRWPQAKILTQTLKASFAGLPAFRPLQAVYLIWQNPYMTIGHDTFIHDVMQRAGLINGFGTHTRYPELTEADLVTARPDVVLLSSEPYPFGEKHRLALEALLPGTPSYLVDGELFSWYGSRLLHTPPYLTRLRTTIDKALSQAR